MHFNQEEIHSHLGTAEGLKLSRTYPTLDYGKIFLATKNGLVNLLGQKQPLHEKALNLSTGLIASDGKGYFAAHGSFILVTEGGKIARGVDVPFDVSSLFETKSGKILVGTNQGHLGELTKNGFELNQSFSDLPSRELWFTPWNPADFDTHSFAQAIDGTIYVCMHVGGVLRSKDDGITWEQLADGLERITEKDGRYDILDGEGLDPDVHDLAAHPSEAGTLLAATRSGFYISENGGESFESRNTGIIPVVNGGWNYQRSLGVFPEGGVLLVATSSGPGEVKDSRIFRSEDRGLTWVQAAGLPIEVEGQIDTIRCYEHGLALALVGPSVYESADYGQSWNKVEGAPTDYFRHKRHHVVRPLMS